MSTSPTQTAASCSNPKRQRITSTEEEESNLPPLYGDKDYWEQRYAKQFRAAHLKNNSHDEAETDIDTVDDNDTTLPYHSWYFTYDELRPILLPILLGGREDARNLIREHNNNKSDSESSLEEEDEEESGEEFSFSHIVPKESITTPLRSGELPNELNKKEDEVKKCEEDSLSDDDEEEDDNGDGDEDIAERDGLAKHGPIAVLEIGCGDCPLGAALALELKEWQDSTSESAHSVVTEIVCTDYSPVVINAMRDQYCSSLTQLITSNDDDKKEEDTASASFSTPYCVKTDVGTIPLEFIVADARVLPYADNSFSLVLEKGTLDAMLSDTVTGVADCVRIVTECARVVSGCIVLISHLNAHTAHGVRWLEEVVVTGLNHHSATACWEIEVHGNSQALEDNDRVPEGSSGPAVYIIHKTIKQTEVTTANSSDERTTAIPIKFFSY